MKPRRKRYEKNHAYLDADVISYIDFCSRRFHEDNGDYY